MTLTQKKAEALGWTFDTTSEPRPTTVEVPIYHASRDAGGTQLLKTHETEDALLADIEAWEAAQPAPTEPTT